MKKNLLVILTLCSLQLAAQHETLLGNVNSIGGFGGPMVEIGSINGEVGADVGGGGALMFENLFLGGYGLGTKYPDIRVDDELYEIRYKQGGFWLGYVAKPDKLVHIYSSLRLGWGKAQLRQDNDPIYSDRLFAMTPELGFEVNLTRFMKVGVTGGYRWISGVNLPSLDSNDFSSPVGLLTFRFGSFDEDWDVDLDF